MSYDVKPMATTLFYSLLNEFDGFFYSFDKGHGQAFVDGWNNSLNLKRKKNWHPLIFLMYFYMWHAA